LIAADNREGDRAQAMPTHFNTDSAAAALDSAIRSRKAVRAFRPDPVPRHLLTEMLEAARAAPSNYNSQPWRVHVLTGEAKRALGEAILRVHDAKTAPPFSPFPEPNPPDSAARVEDFGRRLYSALGIERTDAAARWRQTGRNYVFFGAPVGFIFTIKAAMTKHSWLDCGVFVQTLMLAAQVRGLATCPQVSFVRYQPVVAAQLGLDPDELVTCGVSCGYADEAAAVNRMDMPREPVDGFTRWHGFGG
jgi:nitroreductase